MPHLSEIKVEKLAVEIHNSNSIYENVFANESAVYLFVLPEEFDDTVLITIVNKLKMVEENRREKMVMIFVGKSEDCVKVHSAINNLLYYKSLIAIKRKTPQDGGHLALDNHHFSALVYAGYKQSLQHTLTRIAYSYCPACNKTTKDYGGKKHTYHEFGTSISDIWRDIAVNYNGDLNIIYERFRDLFSIEQYNVLLVFDLRESKYKIISQQIFKDFENIENIEANTNKLYHGDCREELKNVEDNSVDYVFVDPPYNLNKTYQGYEDNLEIKNYFSWCDNWLSDLAKKLKPGRTLSILNIPLWSIRHFKHLEKILDFQSWIVWDALSFPVRKIMPANYTILNFSKGKPRKLPLFDSEYSLNVLDYSNKRILHPLDEDFCLRSSCLESRSKKGFNDSGTLTDLWWDVHRLKHNTRRVDHPTQLPPMLMFRLISIFTHKNELILDCFNGSGTTTLCAEILGRKYIGIEKSEDYVSLATSRHEELKRGIDPFRKEKRYLKAKNSRVPRIKSQVYAVTKKTLQLEVKSIKQSLGRMPSREDVIKYSSFPIEYYDSYFVSWGEVCAAARTTGMTENR